MTFEIQVGDTSLVVSIEPAGVVDQSGGRFRISVHRLADDVHEARLVDVRRSDPGLSLLDEASRRSVEASVIEGPPGEWVVELRGIVLDVLVNRRRSHRAPTRAAGHGGDERVVAPMPGRVIRVLVRHGDEVTAGQGLVVVEAMKMENELRASRPGRVAEIAVADGQSVDAGRLLVRLTARPD
jgi:biotin carboxyl carrier protein